MNGKLHLGHSFTLSKVGYQYGYICVATLLTVLNWFSVLQKSPILIYTVDEQAEVSIIIIPFLAKCVHM